MLTLGFSSWDFDPHRGWQLELVGRPTCWGKGAHWQVALCFFGAMQVAELSKAMVGASNLEAAMRFLHMDLPRSTISLSILQDNLTINLPPGSALDGTVASVYHTWRKIPNYIYQILPKQLNIKKTISVGYPSLAIRGRTQKVWGGATLSNEIFSISSLFQNEILASLDWFQPKKHREPMKSIQISWETTKKNHGRTRVSEDAPTCHHDNTHQAGLRRVRRLSRWNPTFSVSTLPSVAPLTGCSGHWHWGS